MEKIKIPQGSMSDMCRLLVELTQGIQHGGSESPEEARELIWYQPRITGFTWYHRACLPSVPMEELTAILEKASSQNIPLLYYTRECMPQELSLGLLAVGYLPMASQAGMMLSLPGKDFDPDPNVVRIDADQLPEWNQVVCQAFEKPQDSAMEAMISCPQCYFYGYQLDGKLVGTLLLYLTGDNAGIHEVGVAEEYRGQGIAGKLVQTALAEASKKGYTWASLQASEMGQPMYEHMGFRQVGTVCTWVRKS